MKQTLKQVQEERHIGNVQLMDLPNVSRFVIWGFRAVAMGHQRCPAIIEGYESFLEEWAQAGYQALLEFVAFTSKASKRAIKLSSPMCARVTADELSIVAAIHAAQSDQYLLLKMHLNWLLGGSVDISVFQAVINYAGVISQARLHVPMPNIDLHPSGEGPINPAHHSQGQGADNVRTLH